MNATFAVPFPDATKATINTNITTYNKGNVITINATQLSLYLISSIINCTLIITTCKIIILATHLLQFRRRLAHFNSFK
jgi:hypothetical protein